MRVSCRAQQETMGADMDVDDSPEAPDIDIVIGSRETSDDNDQTKLKRIWTVFWDAFNMRPPVDEEPQYVSPTVFHTQIIRLISLGTGGLPQQQSP